MRYQVALEEKCETAFKVKKGAEKKGANKNEKKNHNKSNNNKTKMMTKTRKCKLQQEGVCGGHARDQLGDAQVGRAAETHTVKESYIGETINWTNGPSEAVVQTPEQRVAAQAVAEAEAEAERQRAAAQGEVGSERPCAGKGEGEHQCANGGDSEHQCADKGGHERQCAGKGGSGKQGSVPPQEEPAATGVGVLDTTAKAGAEELGAERKLNPQLTAAQKAGDPACIEEVRLSATARLSLCGVQQRAYVPTRFPTIHCRPFSAPTPLRVSLPRAMNCVSDLLSPTHFPI